MPIEETCLLSYNGLSFISLYSTKVSVRPINDEANRTTTSNEYTIEVRAYVTGAPDTVTETADNLVTRLTKKGGALTYTGHAHDIRVNVDGNSAWDSTFGPHPELVDIVPLGGEMAALVTWRVKTTFPACLDAKYKAAIMELNYSQAWNIDKTGRHTITTSGHAIIPMTRRSINDRNLPDHVDNYREKVVPQIPEGFQRTTKNFRFSLDKRRLDFEIVDVELAKGTSLPGVADNTLVHEVSSGLRNGRGFVRWQGTISGTITMAAGEEPQAAALQFLGLAYYRMSRAIPTTYNVGPDFNLNDPSTWIAAIQQMNNRPQNQQDPARMILITEFRASEEITGPNSSFSLTYEYSVRRRLVDWVRGSGLWTGLVPGTNEYRVWAERMRGSGHHIRGFRQLKGKKEDDAIIDLCLVASTPTVPRTNGATVILPRRPQNGFPFTPPPRPLVQVAGVSDEDNSVDPESSWLDYNIRLEVREQPRLVRHTPTGVATTEQPTRWDVSNSAQRVGRVLLTDYSSAEIKDSGRDIFQEVRPPSQTIYLIGHGARLGHRIPLPQLAAIPGTTVKLNRIVFDREEIPQRYGSTPIWQRAWILEYFVDQPIAGKTPALANPFSGSNGSAGT